MTFRVALESLKSDYSWRLEHKTFQRLLREVVIGRVPEEEEGVASLMEVPDPSRSGRGQEVRSSTSTRLARAGDRGRTKEYSQRLCSRQLVCDNCILVPFGLFNTAIVALASRRRLAAQAVTLPACVLLLDEYQLGDPHIPRSKRWWYISDCGQWKTNCHSAQRLINGHDMFIVRERFF
jgi:hypothetical protein